jgi:hypothetical protein
VLCNLATHHVYEERITWLGLVCCAVLCHVVLCCVDHTATECADVMLCCDMSILQEVVQAPSCCPPEVLPLLSAATAAQQARDVDEAMHLLQVAEEAWRDHLQQQQPTHQHTRQLGKESC